MRGNASIPRHTVHPGSPAAVRRVLPAIEFLRCDCRRLKRLFTRFEHARVAASRAAFAEDLCHALIMRMAVEEEIFYQAFLDATGDTQLYWRAEVEHDALKRLIVLIRDSSPQDEVFTARVRVLRDMVMHHIAAEEQRDGMFAEAASAGLDSLVLGARMKAHRDLLRKRMPLLRWRVSG